MTIALVKPVRHVIEGGNTGAPTGLIAPAPKAALPTTFAAALADYRAKRAFSDAMPLGTPNEDDAVEAYCTAMDNLIENIPAPDAGALAVKMELAFDRFDSGTLPQDVAAALIADAKRLSATWGELEPDASTPNLKASTPNPDTAIFEAFEAYRLALEAFNAASENDREAEYQAAHRRFEATPAPQTIAGVTLCLRFAVANALSDLEPQRVLISGSPAVRAEWFRDMGDTLAEPHLFGAIVALEAMGGR